MSNVVSESSPRVDPSTGRRMNLPAWMREPLLHFIVLGALLFAVDHGLAGRAEDPHTITVDASVDQRARDAFRQEHGREPSAEELQALRRPWLDDEVLYREGIAMQLDKGDPAIRDRVVFKMRGLIEAGLKTPTFDEKTLRDWFEKTARNTTVLPSRRTSKNSAASCCRTGSTPPWPSSAPRPFSRWRRDTPSK